MLHGVQAALDRGWHSLEVQCDNASVVHAINRDRAFPNANMDLVRRIKGLIRTNGCSIRVAHVYREANCVADGLANLAFGQGLEFQWFDVTPPSLAMLCSGDIWGSFSYRNVRR